jgi:hypothetical protein
MSKRSCIASTFFFDKKQALFLHGISLLIYKNRDIVNTDVLLSCILKNIILLMKL